MGHLNILPAVYSHAVSFRNGVLFSASVQDQSAESRVYQWVPWLKALGIHHYKNLCCICIHYPVVLTHTVTEYFRLLKMLVLAIKCILISFLNYYYNLKILWRYLEKKCICLEITSNRYFWNSIYLFTCGRWRTWSLKAVCFSSHPCCPIACLR